MQRVSWPVCPVHLGMQCSRVEVSSFGAQHLRKAPWTWRYPRGSGWRLYGRYGVGVEEAMNFVPATKSTLFSLRFKISSLERRDYLRFIFAHANPNGSVDQYEKPTAENLTNGMVPRPGDCAHRPVAKDISGGREISVPTRCGGATGRVRALGQRYIAGTFPLRKRRIASQLA